MIHLTAEEIHLEGNTEIFVIRNALTVIEEATMLVIVGREENQDPQEVIVMIATQEDIKTKEEDIDLQEEIEMITEEGTEEVQMIEIMTETEELKEVIQGIEGEITIESVQEIKEEAAKIMIEEDLKEMMSQEIRANKKEADQILKVNIEKTDTMKIQKEVIERIEEKETIKVEIKDLKIKEMDRNNIILRENKVKDLKTFLNKKNIKLKIMESEKNMIKMIISNKVDKNHKIIKIKIINLILAQNKTEFIY
jgi:3D (Asp-Asp-Asp) domain-containing protein